MWIDETKLIIINQFDRPCMHLVARVMPNGKIIYGCKKLRRKYPALKRGIGAASLKDFGFIYNVFKKKYVLCKESTAKYSDGKPRKWQGKTEFTYEDIVNSSLTSD